MNRRVVIRPSPRWLAPDWRKRLRSAPPAAWAFVVVLLGIGMIRDRHLLGWIITVVTVVVLFGLPNAMARVNARLVITSETVAYRGVLRHRRQCSHAAVHEVVRLRISVMGPRFPFTRPLLLDKGGNTLVSIQEEWWSPTDMDRFVAELGVPFSTANAIVNPAEANHRHPGAASFLMVHRVIVCAVVAVLFVLLLGIIGAMVTVIGRR